MIDALRKAIEATGSQEALSELNHLVDQIRNLSIYHDMDPLGHTLLTGRALHRLLGDPGYESEYLKPSSTDDGYGYLVRGMDGEPGDALKDT